MEARSASGGELTPHGSAPGADSADRPGLIERRAPRVGRGRSSHLLAGWVLSGVCHGAALSWLSLAPAVLVDDRPRLSGARVVMNLELMQSVPVELAEPIPVEPPPKVVEAIPLVEPLAPPAAEPPPLESIVPESETPAEPPAPTEEPTSEPAPPPAADEPPPPEVTEPPIPQPPVEPPPESETPEPEERKVEPTDVVQPPAPAAAASESTPLGFDDLEPATPLSNPPPEYPAEALRNGWAGRVLLQLAIDESGAVTSARVVESSGHRVLDEAARKAVLSWRFNAATRAGQAVESTAKLPIRFRSR